MKSNKQNNADANYIPAPDLNHTIVTTTQDYAPNVDNTLKTKLNVVSLLMWTIKSEGQALLVHLIQPDLNWSL